MNLLTRHSDYAVQALCYMAYSAGRVSVPDICRELALPRAFIRGILQALARTGYIRSIKGKGGGFELGTDPRAISVADVIEVFEGAFTICHCSLRRKPCPRREHCKLRKTLLDVEHAVRETLASTTIADLL